MTADELLELLTPKPIAEVNNERVTENESFIGNFPSAYQRVFSWVFSY
jgi:hypothetical protein